MSACAYGQTFEPDPPPGAPVRKGQQDAARPLVLAPAFPLPDELQPGDIIPLRALFIASAMDFADPVLRALDFAAQQKGLHQLDEAPTGPRGLPRLTLRLVGTERFARRLTHLSAQDLVVSSTARVPELTVELTSPLAISVANRVTDAPRFVDLLAASTRVISHLFCLYDQPLDVDFEALKELAERVAPTTDQLRAYAQPITSNRARQKHEFRGVVGTACYADVPLCLLPWLLWGGWLHVGERRVAGAGGWRLRL
jgi:hypothetical protein